MHRHRSRSISAFTLLEVLVVLGIIAIVAALAFPAFQSAKERSKHTVCVSNMRQCWMAAMIYRSEHDGDGKYGASEDMGLPLRFPFFGSTPPHPPEVLARFPHLLLKVDKLKCSSWPSKLNNTQYSYNWMYQDKATQNNQNRWDKYVQEFEDGAIFVTDVNHNSNDIPTMSGYISKFGQGILLGGTLVKPRKPGDTDILRWWTTPCSSNCSL